MHFSRWTGLIALETPLMSFSIGLFRLLIVSFFMLVPLAGCSYANVAAQDKNTDNAQIHDNKSVIEIKTHWLRESSGEVLLDPQTSGLALWRDGSMLTISDGSAHSSQVLKVMQIDLASRSIVKKIPITLAETVQKGCFAEYLSNRPDLEALVVDPDNDKVLISVTEDASRYQLTPECAKRFADTGSTLYPTLLVRIELNEPGDSATMTHVRPLQYTPDMQVGNSPNDGIEGMAFGHGRNLYLALEKDANYSARLFWLHLRPGFWESDAFTSVKDTGASIPTFNDKMPHPINGLSFVRHNEVDWVLAAARNDSEIWLIDVAGSRDTIRAPMTFLAEIDGSDHECSSYEMMNNYSIEGIAVKNADLWMVNDPWKLNYGKNIKCSGNKQNFENMAPLISKVPLDALFAFGN